MKGKGRKSGPQFKINIAIEAIRERHTLAERTNKFKVSAVITSRWKKEILENNSKAFGLSKHMKEKGVDNEKLYA